MKKILLTLAALVMSTSIALAAMSLDTAKSQGFVGEQPDGLIGAVSAPTSEVRELIQDTNAERMARYNSIAAKNGTDVEKVKALVGKKLIESAPSGQYIKTGSGSWVQK